MTGILHRACAKGQLDTAARLISAGIGVDHLYCSKTPLMVACCRRRRDSASLDIVAMLITFGADLELRDDEGKTALTWAIARDRPDIAKILLDAGARPLTARDD